MDDNQWSSESKISRHNVILLPFGWLPFWSRPSHLRQHQGLPGAGGLSAGARLSISDSYIMYGSQQYATD